MQLLDKNVLGVPNDVVQFDNKSVDVKLSLKPDHKK